MFDLFKKTAALGLGAAVLTKEKIETTVEELIKKGEMQEDVGKKLVKDLLEKGESQEKELEHIFQEVVEKFLEKANIATKNDLNKMRDELDQLKSMVNQEQENK